MHRPNFAKLSMKAGASEESVGGSESSLVQKKEGGEVEPRSIGMIGKVWIDFLRYVQAMMHVKLPDGTIYGQEAGFMVLEECFAEYASQRKTVAAVCGALTEGWKKFCDELVTSNESFVAICRDMKKQGVWVENEVPKRNNSEGSTSSAEVKRLKAELAKVKSPSTPWNPTRQLDLNAGSGVVHNHPFWPSPRDEIGVQEKRRAACFPVLPQGGARLLILAVRPSQLPNSPEFWLLRLPEPCSFGRC